jgi:hypothetical protein
MIDLLEGLFVANFAIILIILNQISYILMIIKITTNILTHITIHICIRILIGS